MPGSTVLVNLGSATASVETDDPPWAAVLRSCFADLPSTASPKHRFITRTTAPGRMSLEEEGTILGSDDGAGPTLRVLQSRLNALHIEGSPCPVTVHGAGVVIDGRAVVVAAPAGGGKTSLIAELLPTAEGYLGDEAIGISTDGRVLHGFPKPLNVKPGLFRLRPRLTELAVSDPSGGADLMPLVAASSVGPTVGPTWRAAPGMVVLLRRIDDQGVRVEPDLRPLSPAEGVQRVAGSVFGLDPSSEDALIALCGLATRCPIAELTYSDMADAAQLLASSARWPAAVVVEAPIRCPTPLGCGGSGPHAGGAVCVEFGGEALFFDPTSRMLIRGDAVTAAVWRRADGSPAPRLVETVVSEGWPAALSSQALEDLLAIGLLV
jgi:hypothetical protein